MRRGIKYNKATKRYYIDTTITLSNGKPVHFQYRPKDDSFKNYKYVDRHYHEIVNERKILEEEKLKLAKEMDQKAISHSIKKIDTFQNRLKEVMEDKQIESNKLSESTTIIKTLMLNLSSKKQKPSVEEVYLIANELGVNPLWLIGYNINKTEVEGTKGEIISLLNKLNNEQLLKANEILKENFKDIETK